MNERILCSSNKKKLTLLTIKLVALLPSPSFFNIITSFTPYIKNPTETIKFTDAVYIPSTTCSSFQETLRIKFRSKMLAKMKTYFHIVLK